MSVYSNSSMTLGKQWEQFGPENWVYRNFLSAEEIAELMQEMKDTESKVSDPYSYDIEGLNKYKQRIFDSLEGTGFDIRDMKRISRRTPGAGHVIHADVENFITKFLEIILPIDTDIKHYSKTTGGFGMILYINDDYVGGEICYPEFDIEYKPSAGDLVIHLIEAVHGVKTVISGERYTHAAGIDLLVNVDAEKYDSGNWPWESNYVRNESDFYMDIHKEPLLHKRLADFKLKYIEQGLYGATFSDPNQIGADPMKLNKTVD